MELWQNVCLMRELCYWVYTSMWHNSLGYSFSSLRNSRRASHPDERLAVSSCRGCQTCPVVRRYGVYISIIPWHSGFTVQNIVKWPSMFRNDLLVWYLKDYLRCGPSDVGKQDGVLRVIACLQFVQPLQWQLLNTGRIRCNVFHLPNCERRCSCEFSDVTCDVHE